MPKRTDRTNAERQRAYRKRQKERNATVTVGIGEPTVTVVTVQGDNSRDFRDSMGSHVYLGNWGSGDVFALDVTDVKHP